MSISSVLPAVIFLAWFILWAARQACLLDRPVSIPTNSRNQERSHFFDNFSASYPLVVLAKKMRPLSRVLLPPRPTIKQNTIYT